MKSKADMEEIREEASDAFPYSGMRLLALMQINVGVLVFVLGVVDLVLTTVLHDSQLQSYGSRYKLVVTLTAVSSPLWCGLWYSITGAIGASLVREREHSLLYCRVGYLLLNMMCSALFGPICAVLSGFISYTRHTLDRSDYQWLISLVVCFLAIIEVLMASVSTSIACCCSTLRSTQIHVYVNPRNLKSAESVPSSTKRRHSCPVCQEASRSPPRGSRHNTISPSHQLGCTRAADTGGCPRFCRHQYRSQDLEHSAHMFGAASSYEALKKWALPRA